MLPKKFFYFFTFYFYIFTSFIFTFTLISHSYEHILIFWCLGHV